MDLRGIMNQANHGDLIAIGSGGTLRTATLIDNGHRRELFIVHSKGLHRLATNEMSLHELSQAEYEIVKQEEKENTK